MSNFGHQLAFVLEWHNGLAELASKPGAVHRERRREFRHIKTLHARSLE